MTTKYSYRHKDAKDGLMAPVVVPPEFIYSTAYECLAFMNANLRDPQDFVVIEGDCDLVVREVGGYPRTTLTPRRVVERVMVKH